jgi:hypothetical protein
MVFKWRIKIKTINMAVQLYREILETSTPCNGRNYLPYPPRLWHRSISPCYEFIQDTRVFIPYLKRDIPTSELGALISMFRKGNVLQYPANRSGDSKNKKFSNISKGYGKRKKGWGTQTDSFTNPNISKLERKNANVLANNPNDVFFFPECQLPIKKNKLFPIPSQPTNPVNYPDVPDGTPNEPTNGPIAYPIVPTPDPGKLNPSIIEGGNLITCTTENICSGIVLSTLEQIACHPTSDSDVPGPIINLCYPKNIPVTIPRQRTTYVSNATKWPINGITTLPAYNTNLPLDQTPNIDIFLNILSQRQS